MISGDGHRNFLESSKGQVINYLWGKGGRHPHIFDGIFTPPIRFMLKTCPHSRTSEENP